MNESVSTRALSTASCIENGLRLCMCRCAKPILNLCICFTRLVLCI